MKTMPFEATQDPGWPITLEERRLAEGACSRLIVGYCVSADSKDAEMFVQLFAHDATWRRSIGDLVGHEMIGAFFRARPANEITFHSASNILVELVTPDRARATSFATVYRHVGLAVDVPLLRPSSIVEYQDEFARDANGAWLIQSRTSRTVLRERPVKEGDEK